MNAIQCEYRNLFQKQSQKWSVSDRPRCSHNPRKSRVFLVTAEAMALASPPPKPGPEQVFTPPGLMNDAAQAWRMVQRLRDRVLKDAATDYSRSQ